MFTPYIRKYESGFSRFVSSAEGVLDITPDPEVVDLFARMTSGTTSTSNWPFVRQLVLCARRLFNDDLREWLREQEKNTSLPDSARDFLNETVAFINTGTRPVSIGARLRVLVREQQQGKPNPGLTAIQPITDMATAPITQWLSQEDGIVDMVFTLNVLFGKALSPQQ